MTYPRTARRAAIAAVMVLLAILAILGALRAAQSVPAGTPIPACVSDDGSGPTPCHWDARTQGNGKGESFTVWSR